MENQVAVAELGGDLGGGGFSDTVTLETEQALVQAWVDEYYCEQRRRYYY